MSSMPAIRWRSGTGRTFRRWVSSPWWPTPPASRPCRRSVSRSLAARCYGRRPDRLRRELAVLEQHQGRDRADAELAGDGRILVDIELGDLHLALHLGGDGFERRTDHLARSAPFGPEIDHHRLRRLEDVGL